MSENYEKQALGYGAMGGNAPFPNFPNYAPSYSGYQAMPNLNIGAAQPNRYAQGASPNFTKADSAGVQQALAKFQGGATKLGAEDIDFLLMKAREMSKKPGFSFERVKDEEREEFARKKQKEAVKAAVDYLARYQKNYPDYNWKDHAANIRAIQKPYEGWSGFFKGMTYLAPGAMDTEKRNAVRNYLMGKNKQYPLPKGSQPWHVRSSGKKSYLGNELGNFEPMKPKAAPAMNKSGAQDNDTPSRSAVGESALTYKMDDKAHATGSEAWDSVGRYMKTAELGDPEAVKRAFAALGLEKEANWLLNTGKFLARPFTQGFKVFSRSRSAGKPFLQSAGQGMRSASNVARATPVRSALAAGGALAGGGYLANKGYNAMKSMFGGGAGGQGGYDRHGMYGGSPFGTAGMQQGSSVMSHNANAGVEPLLKSSEDFGLTPYQYGFVERAHSAGLSADDLADGVEKVAEYMGEEYAEELREGLDKMAEAMEKQALNLGWLTRAGQAALKGGKYLLGYGDDAARAMKSVSNAAGNAGGLSGRGGVAGFANRLFDSTKGRALSQNAQKAMGNDLGGIGGQALRSAMGGFTGMGAVDDDAHWGTKALAGLGGAAFGRYMPRMGANARAAGLRSMIGGGLGYAGDTAAGLAGYDTGNNLRQMGTVGGFLSPLMRGQTVGRGLREGGFQLPNLAAAGSRLGSKSNVLPGLGNTIRKVDDAYFSNPLKNKLGLGLLAAESAPSLAGAGIGMVNDRIRAEGDFQRQQALQDVFSLPQVQEALNAGQRGSELLGTLDRVGAVADPLLQMMGMDPSQMSPLAKIALMAGGGMALGGLAGGATGAGAGTGAGLGGLAGIAIPLLMASMQGQGGGAQGRLGPGGDSSAANQEALAIGEFERRRRAQGLPPMSYEEAKTEFEKAQG